MSEFNRGDFLKKDSKKGSFMIYEGNNLSDTSYKKMTLICYYDPEKYVLGPVGYETKPSLEIASNEKPCVTTIDTEQEDFWIKKCSEKEKQDALAILRDKYKLEWIEETLTLVDMETGDIIRKVAIPDNSYYGQVIHPITDGFKDLLKEATIKKLTPSYSSSNYEYHGYQGGYGEDFYD